MARAIAKSARISEKLMMASRTVLKNVHELILFSIALAIVLEAVKGGKRSVTWSNNVNEDGFVTSPNYPNNYPDNYEGIWKFKVPQDHRLELEFDSFELEAHDSCKYDYVAVFDGSLESHPLLGKFCGIGTPSPIIKTTAGEMLMIFRTDESNVRKGFKVTHKTKFNLQAIVSTETGKDLLNQYLLKTTPQQPYITNKWGVDVTRTAVSLFLTNPRYFAPGFETGEQIAYELTLQLMSKLVMKKRISTKDLAAFVNAMTVACINPRKFFGLNVVAELRKRIDSNNDTNPFFLLALCIGWGDISIQDVKKLQQLFYADLRHSWIGTQAAVVMALQCISRKSQINLNTVLAEMVLKLKEKQQNNGTVENSKTTALVIQALVATNNYKSNFNMSMAIKSILKEKMYRYLSSETIYYILPIIQWKTFLDINSNHCEKFIKTELEETKKLTAEHPDGDIHVQISIIIGDDMDLSRTWRIKVPANYSFYQVMENISSTDPDYKVQYTILEGKPFVVGLNKYEDSIENGLFWFTYKKPFSSNSDLVLDEKSPTDIQVRETNELILWYRSRPWTSAQEISTDTPSTVTTYKPLASTTDVTSTDTSDESLASTNDVTSTDTSDESLARTTEADTDKFFWDF